MSNSKRALLCFFGSDPLIGQGEELPFPWGDTASFQRLISGADLPTFCDRLRDENELKVGFTFLTLENRSNKSIDEIEIVYRYHKETDVNEQIEQLYGVRSNEDLYTRWESPEAIDATIDSTPDDAEIHEFMLEKLGDKDLIEFKSRKAESQTRKIAALAPGEKVIILLNVFYSDETLNFLPGYYVDGNVFVEKLVFRVGKRTVSRAIRDPFGEQAARKSLSWGWASQ